MSDTKNWTDLPGCGNHYCLINPPTGMGTNGPCTCFRNSVTVQRYVYQTRKEIERLEALSSKRKPSDILIASMDPPIPGLDDSRGTTDA